MRKTRIQMELIERKKQEKANNKECKRSKKKRSIKEVIIQMPIRAKILLAGVGIGIIVIPLAVTLFTLEHDTINDDINNGYNVSDKYIAYDDGNIKFLNGSEVLTDFPNMYKMNIKATVNEDASYTSEYSVEVDTHHNITYHYGTYSGSEFNEAHLIGENYNIFLCKSDDKYIEADEINYAYLNGKSVIEAVLSGDGIKKIDGKYISQINVDEIKGYLPVVKKNVESSNNDDVEEFVQVEKATAELFTKDNKYFIKISNDKLLLEIQIEDIAALSVDFNLYMP